MSELVASVARAQLGALSRLRELRTPEGLARRLAQLGYRVELSDEVLGAFAFAEAMAGAIDELARRLIYERPALEDIPGLALEVVGLIDQLRDLAVPGDTAGLPPELGEAAFWQDFAEAILDDMIRDMLRRNAPALKLVMFATGLVKYEDAAGFSDYRSGMVERLDFDAFGAFLAGPDAVLADRFGLGSSLWGGEQAEALARHLGDVGIELRPRKVSPKQAAATQSMTVAAGDFYYELKLIGGVLLGTTERREAGLRLLPSPEQSTLGLGLFATPNLQGAQVAMGGDWVLDFGVESDELIAMAVSPGGVAVESQSGALRMGLSRDGAEPGIVVGAADQTRLEFQDFQIETALLLSAGDLEAQLRLAVEQLALKIVPGDNLLSEILGGEVGAALDIEVKWSSKTGVTFGGSAGFQFTLPAEIAIGPVTLSEVTLEFAVEGSDPAFAATAGILGEFGPFAVTIGEMGVELRLVRAPDDRGLIGPFDLAAGFRPPTEFGLSIDAEAVKGGGFIDIDGTRYSGALSLKVISVGIGAITVVDTALPGNPDGWACFAALSLEFPSIPLGFGFTLSGLGGIVALNRGIDTVAIASGLKDGVVDALLFPDDPVRDAPMLIAMIDDYFPLLDGNTVIGPVVEIGWGAPKTLITAQLGIVVSLPEGKIALLGSIAALLPDPDAPLLSLKLDLVGEVDFPAGTAFMAASLYDSRLLQTIELSGDMGFFLATRDRPYFLMSVGGYHPGFEPSSLVPAPLHDLRRMNASLRIADNVTIAIDSYFAVTSNTVQFGAGLVLEMTQKIVFKTYTARGSFGFDVLLQFDPFAIIADIEASVGVYSGDKELMGVHLAAHLEGPEPWFASGRAEFKFFGIGVSFNVEVGASAADGSKTRVPLRDQVLDALEAPSAWAETTPATGVLSNLTYIEIAPAGDAATAPLWLRPDHGVRAAQAVAPLNRQIDVVGQGLPEAGHEMLTITGASLGGAATGYEETTDWFAPAQFERLGRREKLSRASFEEMTAGVSFGAGAARTTAHPDTLATTSSLDHEEGWCQSVAPRVLDFTVTDAAAPALGLAAQRLNAAQPRPEPAFAVAPVGFAVVDAITGAAVPGALAAGTNGQGAALAAAASQSGVRVVPAASLGEAGA